ncbi:5-(carboxyamino)imidazole ribonucleotide synthase [Catalinimonas alkaloidigena]|uniref:5-(carboxyamino)imidazole ribonucleotide synthase n=1 Tax=Catalinimonas alkaloidigena TaxID=1075417 RepID=UPI0024055512|nr:5-(carboxyamino)imidazole ribonucleotide synthase [Catalinimonas alkaloidigena]MDF9800542.1 5-(carboxyamino)imidazole ribonucleotide synthase [Catalinimonas alkaloidigena]
MSVAFYQNFKLGVLGGGQLGRMLIQSAIDFNLDVWILDPDENAPCKNIATQFFQGSLTDFDTVYNFGRQCDLVTIEIENVNTQALKKLQEEGVKVYPEPQVIELIQDKRAQKTFYKEHNIPTADFVLTENKEDVRKYIAMLPAVHKLGKEGYDGRGVQKITTSQELDKAFETPGLLEKLIDFEKELAVIVARNEKGEMKTFPVVELVFHPEHNLVEYLFAPANIGEQIASDADALAKEVIEKLGMTGLLAVEMFLTKEGKLLVNEIAPRTHNSGHHSIEANVTSQFEQHLRAILNMPLGSTATKVPAAMVNLLGEDGFTGLAKLEGLEETLSIEGVKVHLYGKKLTKPFRKMGHITIIDQDINALKKKVEQVKHSLKIKA